MAHQVVAPQDPPKHTRSPAHVDGAQVGRCAALVVVTMAVLIGVAFGVGEVLGDSTGIDRSVSERFADRRTSFLNNVTSWFSQLGSTIPVIGIAVTVIIICFVVKRHNALIILAVGMVGEVLMFLAIAALVSRARPAVSHLDSAPPTSSYPSGHVFATTALWGSIAIVAYRQHWREWLRSLFTVLAVVLPVIVAFSRVYRGMHHLTDVIASIALGAMWLLVLVHVFPVRTAAPTETAETR